MEVEKLGPKWIRVDLDQWEKNLNWIAKRVHPAQVIPVIKANAYGHGAIKLAQVCEKMGIKTVAVATLREALELRRNFIRMDVLIFGATPKGQILDVINYKVTPTVCDADYAKALQEQARRLGQRVKVHVYVDTGMGRMGQTTEDIHDLIEALPSCPNVEVEGLYSHYAVSDELDSESQSYSEEQWKQLLNCYEHFEKKPKLLHMANSGAVLNHEKSWAQAVRPGLLCYGLANGDLDKSEVRPLMSLECLPLYIKRMKKGDSIGYGRVFRLEKDKTIMTLPVGYADGVPRRLGTNLKVSLKGKHYPIVGRICMDMMMVDLGDDTANHDDIVTLMGGEALPIVDWAKFLDTIPYEILTHFGRRWGRLYTRGDRVDEMFLSDG